ncbi:hypothetical protein Bind_3901 (plasmid) [Beijerinckia indica subsp. indica ATCC 9039]|uniref:Uncharacterized protein n=1 Tax=Beijerinckia indica subsp. indica (strain ATCC 9039 / DSM 1715 / NCIMB 8712) TaxID=395963 RepID=B2ILM8_BEII9|nr:hypothetical protein Bind_3901 [Beijerinckia indica subsp. indica ATCC 9039]
MLGPTLCGQVLSRVKTYVLYTLTNCAALWAAQSWLVYARRPCVLIVSCACRKARAKPLRFLAIFQDG